MRFFPNFKQFFRDLVKVKTDSHNVETTIKDSNVTINMGAPPTDTVGQTSTPQATSPASLTGPAKPSVVTHLSDLDQRILKILAEGGRAVPALDEHGVVIQVNIYGHPKQDSIDCVAEETLKSYRWLLRNRLIAEDFSTGQREYVATETGRQIGIEYPTPIWPC